MRDLNIGMDVKIHILFFRASVSLHLRAEIPLKKTVRDQKLLSLSRFSCRFSTFIPIRPRSSRERATRGQRSLFSACISAAFSQGSLHHLLLFLRTLILSCNP